MPTTKIQINTGYDNTGAGAAQVALGKVGTASQKAERDLAAYARTVAQAQRAMGNIPGSIKTYESALSQLNKTSKEAIQIERQIATLRKADLGPTLPRSLEKFGPQALEQIQQGLLGIVGPAALVTTGFGLAEKSVTSFIEAFKYKGDLDALNLSITTGLEGVRDQGQLFREAQQFADKYRLTQKETSEAIQASIPILRSSHASLTDIEGTLLRLQSKKPEKSIADAARALDELKSGQIVSIVDQFNISRDAANKMKDEIRDGADAVKVLSDYLDTAGIGGRVLEDRAKGIKGAFNEAVIAQEKLQLAQAKFAEGPGVNFLGGITAGISEATKLFGDGGIYKNGTAIAESNAAALLTFQAVLAKTGSFEQALTAAVRLREKAYDDLTGGLRQQAEVLQTGAGASDAATQAALYYGNRVRDAGNAADDASGKVDKLTDAQRRQAAAQGLESQRLGEHAPGTSGLAEQAAADAVAAQATYRRLAQPAKDEAERQAQQLADVEFDNRLKKAKTTSDKIALLRQKEAGITDPVERARIEGQIIDLQLSGAKAYTSELDKQTKLIESQYDARQKQLTAELGLSEAIVRDRQQDWDDAQALKTARAIQNSPLASADMKARAADKEALILIQDQQRGLDINQKKATANGSIVNGRLLQSQPVAGPISAPVAAAAPANAPANAPVPPAAGNGRDATLTVQLVVDGKTLADVSEPYIWDSLMKAVRGL